MNILMKEKIHIIQKMNVHLTKILVNKLNVLEEIEEDLLLINDMIII